MDLANPSGHAKDADTSQHKSGIEEGPGLVTEMEFATEMGKARATANSRSGILEP